jgi:hypothetical protein
MHPDRNSQDPDPDALYEPGEPVPISERWKEPPGLSATPPDATPEEKLRLRFPAVPPPKGTPDREEWDRLGMDVEDKNREGER